MWDPHKLKIAFDVLTLPWSAQFSPWQGQDSKSKKLGFLKKVSLTFFPKKIFLITFSHYFMLFITLNKIYLKIVFFNESFNF